jgi:phosphopantothenoylcysteine decarboxylase/phosphopantothenate--cysteine ligase
MGYAIARAAYEAGAEVTLVSGPTDLDDIPGIKMERVETTEEMFRAVKKHFGRSDYLIMAAAPADFKLKKQSKSKIKKSISGLSLELNPTIDILNSLSRAKKSGQKIIGFALETDNAIKNARAKLKDKNLDLIVLNIVKGMTPFDNDTNEVTIIDKKGKAESIPRMSKTELAVKLIDRIAAL